MTKLLSKVIYHSQKELGKFYLHLVDAQIILMGDRKKD